MKNEHITFLLGNAEADRALGMDLLLLAVGAMLLSCVVHVAWNKAGAWWRVRRVSK